MGKGIFRAHDSIWVEKYRPVSLDEYITSSEMKEKFNAFIEKQDIPHLLFEGPPGTGKSSMANLLVKALDCDVKYINAAEENGIDTVRDTIKNYCVTSSFSKIKVIVLDEFSEFTPAGQLALNAVMEQYSEHTKFILTCNNVENIIEKIRSRCQEFRVIPPSKEQVKDRCEFILKSEGVDYEEEELVEIIRHNYPDVRKVIQYLDQHSIGKVLKLDKEFFKLLKYEKTVVEILKKTTAQNKDESVTKIRQLLADTRVKNFLTLYKYLYEKLDDYAKPAKVVPIIFHLADGQRADTLIADKEINMIATILRIVDTITT